MLHLNTRLVFRYMCTMNVSSLCGLFVLKLYKLDWLTITFLRSEAKQLVQVISRKKKKQFEPRSLYKFIAICMWIKILSHWLATLFATFNIIFILVYLHLSTVKREKNLAEPKGSRLAFSLHLNRVQKLSERLTIMIYAEGAFRNSCWV